MTLVLLFVLGIVLGLAVAPGWFWLAGFAVLGIMIAELAS